MKTLNAKERSEALKKKFLHCFGVRATCAMALQKVVKRLLQQGVSRDVLYIWGVDAGHPRTTVSSTLSRIFCAIGLRTRINGAGRKPSPDAPELLDYARGQYGERSLKVLYAALRAGKARAAENCQIEPRAAYVSTIPSGPALRSLENNCTSAIKNGSKTSNLNKAPRLRIGGTSFKRTSGTTINAGNQTRGMQL